MNKKILFPAVALAVAGLITIGAVSANAYFGGGQHHDEMVKELAEKLGIDQSKVQSAFDEIHEEHMEQVEAHVEERLNQAVADGKITESQKTAIIAKHEELQTKHEQEQETFQNMTPEERRTERQNERSELKTWAEEQGIDLDLFFFGGRGPQGEMRGFGHGMME